MALDAQTKDEIFRNPTTGRRHFGRYLATLRRGPDRIAAVQEGLGRDTRILLLIDRDGDRRFVELPGEKAYRPALALLPAGRLAVAWNEATDSGWAIRLARLGGEALAVERVDTVFGSDSLVMPPTLATRGEELWLAWSGLVGGDVRVRLAEALPDGTARTVDPLSPAGVDCFRPQVAAMGQRLLLAWDRYDRPDYRIDLCEYVDDRCQTLDELGGDGERWLCPRLLAGQREALLTGLVVQDVIDDELGIVDHGVFAPVARFDGDRLSLLHDGDHPEDPRIVADLRDGLLAETLYKGHVGLRRNPQLALDEAGRPVCFWESRRESPDSGVTARLIARRHDGQRWQQPVSLCDDGYAWSVAGSVEADTAAVAFLRFTESDRDVIQTRPLPLVGEPVEFDPARWNRWRKVTLRPPDKPRRTLDVDGQGYRLVWADTHVHSVFSADAEGEPDELVHFARDVAGLDAVCLIDNDYYPHKALTEPEWRVHQALAAHFTRPGEFVFLPGYEFTYHRADLDPDFNHRCVIFPRTGPLQRRIDPESGTDAEMIAGLRETGGMAYPHHCSYALLDEAVEWNIEACSSWRVCLEETDFTLGQLRQGRRIGFVGSSDTHRMVPGLGGARTGLWVTELTPEGLFEGYRSRRCLATQGRNVLIDFRVNGRVMGSTVSVGSTGLADCEVYVKAPGDIEFVDLVCDGEARRLADRPGRTFEHRRAETIGPGGHFLFVRVKLLGDASFNVEGEPVGNPLKPFSQDSRYPHNLARAQGPFAWSSPVWVAGEGI